MSDEQEGGRKRFGIYTGIVHDVADPEEAGRIRVIVPSIMGQEVLACWALMGGQYLGAKSSGRSRRGRGSFRVPPVGSQVVVQFLDGDVHAPVWTPGIWPREKVPPAARARGYPERSVLARGEKLDVVEDADGNVEVGTERDGMKVSVDTRGGDLEVTTSGLGGGVIKMQGGTVLQGAARVGDTVNCGTLTVAFQPVTGFVIGVTYTPPLGAGAPIVMSLATGLTTAPMIGKILFGSTSVFIGG